MVKVIKQLVHDVFRLLLVNFSGWLFHHRHGFFGLLTGVIQELVHSLLIFSEFLALFAARLLLTILFIPNVGAVVLVTESLIIHDEVIVTKRLLSTDILLLVNFLKYSLRLFNLHAKF